MSIFCSHGTPPRGWEGHRVDLLLVVGRGRQRHEIEVQHPLVRNLVMYTHLSVLYTHASRDKTSCRMTRVTLPHMVTSPIKRYRPARARTPVLLSEAFFAHGPCVSQALERSPSARTLVCWTHIHACPAQRVCCTLELLARHTKSRSHTPSFATCFCVRGLGFWW